ncbi:MAG: hypothetical protein AVDCRST_MAG20-991 [uncultured Acidimicrobiales bacterium]|uniref:Glycosyltransferase RgtA/B/C/D-like domain-containing protein n=1 Tax=uncultured Acidimicrobiales bacterium TaxID=310071 RepID=A0A6J4HJR8_9ACTN|nr:MAG: hypothetical protein AVDCRST_MAG20-991 [uncultured Acidimicrobiales bacterium]
MTQLTGAPWDEDLAATLHGRSDDGAGAGPTRGRGRRARAAALGLTIVALLPVLVVVVTRTGRDYLPVQDLAYIDLRVRDVWSGNLPLTGPYSRGFNHPGPMLFWLIGVPSGLLGSPAWATLVGGAVLQGVAIAGSAALAWRRGGLAVVLAILLALHLGYPGGYLFLHHWNPNIAFPFLALYLLLLWSVSLGERRLLPWTVVVGTFLLQSHVGYLLLVGLPAAWTAWVVGRDAGGLWAALRAWARPLRTSAIVGAVLWSPVVIEQVADSGRTGNLTKTWRYFTESEDPVSGLETGLGLWATEFRLPPPWFGGDQPTAGLSPSVLPSSLAWLLVPAVLICVAAWCNRRRPSRSASRFASLMVVASACGIVAMSGLRGETIEYLFIWRSLLATMLLASLVLLVAPTLGLHRRRYVAGAVAVVAVGVLLVEVWGTTRYVARSDRGQVLPYEPVAADVVEQLEDEGPPPGPVLIRGSGLGGIMEGVFDELDRQGVPMRVDREWGYKWGHGRVATPAEVDAVWYIVQDGHLVSDLTGRRGADELFRTTPLAEADEAALVQLQRRLGAQLRREGRPELVGYLDSSLFPFLVEDVGGLDQADLDRLATLNEEVELSGACRCAVVAFPPSAAEELQAEVALYRLPLPER